MNDTANRPAAEIRALTGLRGIAALDVVLGHYNIHNDFGLQLFIFHDAAVDMFFALSSFTLCLVYGTGGTRINWRRYAVARFARIYPLYFVVTLLGLYLAHHAELRHLATPAGRQLLKHLFSQLLLIASLPFPTLSGFWVPPAWSIPIEAFCYVLVYPALRAVAPSIRSTRRLLVLIALTTSAGLIMYVRHYNPAVNGIGFAAPADPWAYWVPLTRGVAMFVAGWAAFMVYEREPNVARAVGLALDAIAAYLLLIIVGEAFALVRKQAVVLVAPFLIMGLMDARSLTARVLSSRPIHGLGLISYSVYLLHIPVYQLTLHYAPRLAATDAWRICAPLLLSLVAASASYLLFETPARRLIRSLDGSNRRAA